MFGHVFIEGAVILDAARFLSLAQDRAVNAAVNKTGNLFKPIRRDVVPFRAELALYCIVKCRVVHTRAPNFGALEFVIAIDQILDVIVLVAIRGDGSSGAATFTLLRPFAVIVSWFAITPVFELFSREITLAGAATCLSLPDDASTFFRYTAAFSISPALMREWQFPQTRIKFFFVCLDFCVWFNVMDFQGRNLCFAAKAHLGAELLEYNFLNSFWDVGAYRHIAFPGA